MKKTFALKLPSFPNKFLSIYLSSGIILIEILSDMSFCYLSLFVKRAFIQHKNASFSHLLHAATTKIAMHDHI